MGQDSMGHARTAEAPAGGSNAPAMAARTLRVPSRAALALRVPSRAFALRVRSRAALALRVPCTAALALRVDHRSKPAVRLFSEGCGCLPLPAQLWRCYSRMAACSPCEIFNWAGAAAGAALHVQEVYGCAALARSDQLPGHLLTRAVARAPCGTLQVPGCRAGWTYCSLVPQWESFR